MAQIVAQALAAQRGCTVFYLETFSFQAPALYRRLGYEVAASVAKEAHATGRSLREVVLARGLLDAATLDRALDPRTML